MIEYCLNIFLVVTLVIVTSRLGENSLCFASISREIYLEKNRSKTLGVRQKTLQFEMQHVQSSLHSSMYED